MKVGYTALCNYVSVQRSVTHQIVRLNVLNKFCVGRVSVKSLPGRLERVLCAADARFRVRTQSGKRVGGVLERRGRGVCALQSARPQRIKRALRSQGVILR